MAALAPIRRLMSTLRSNRGVVYVKPGVVEVRDLPAATLDHPVSKKKMNHAVILRVIATNICGSDQHMITGEVIECGSDVEAVEKGDLVSVPFNIGCGRCVNCLRSLTNLCLRTNPKQPGAAYGYVDMGGWQGGQARYVTVPYADFNLMKFPDRHAAMEKITDLAMLTDILPTGYHGCVTAGVQPGSTVYIAGAGPVGLAAAASAHLLGAACVIVGDLIPDRLKQAKALGYETIDVSAGPVKDQLVAILGEPEVDCGVDCVGFEARGCGHHHAKEVPAQVLNDMMQSVRAGGAMGLPGLYVVEDPLAVDDAAKQGSLSLKMGMGWAKALSIFTGQTPVMRYHRKLARAIMFDRIKPAKVVNATVIDLEDAAAGYRDFDKGAAKKYVLDPHGDLKKHHCTPSCSH